MTRKATEQVTTIGIDIGKNSFHPHPVGIGEPRPAEPARQ